MPVFKVKEIPLRKLLLQQCGRLNNEVRFRLSIFPTCSHPQLSHQIELPPIQFDDLNELREFAEQLPENDSEITFDHYIFKGEFALVSFRIELNSV